MSIAETKSALQLQTDERCKKVAKLYNTGTNCDKAVLMVIQEILKIPSDRWDFGSFYSENPDAELFICKALAAGALSVYIDIISKMDTAVETDGENKNSIERVIRVFNTYLQETSQEEGKNPAEFNLFEFDEQLKGVHIDESLKTEYAERVKHIYSIFMDRFKVCNCQEILGFDPFRYAEYDEKMQEYIEEGEWMQKCGECMQFIVKIMCKAA